MAFVICVLFIEALVLIVQLAKKYVLCFFFHL
jgi:hypothetical protein